MELTGKQRRALRALGHHLKPVVQVGHDDVSEGVVAAVDEQLTAHELIKVKVGEGASGRHEVAEKLAGDTKSALVQVLGRTILLYRRHPDKPKIELWAVPARARAPERRVPRQARARETVDVILQAAARVPVEDGYASATTKRIAEVAGVSIGSLYQYFPSKAAIVVELSRRQSERITAAMEQRSRSHRSLEELNRALVAALAGAYAQNPALSKLLLEQLPQLGALRGVADAQARVESLIRSRLSNYLHELRPRDLELAVFMLTRAVRAVVWATVTERPEVLGTDALVDELAALALGFLRRT